VRQVFAALDSSRINFRTFSAKVNIDYRDAENKRYDINANLRMVKDSAIWLSANAILGIEALRMLVTSDSVKLLDKQNKTYTARSIDYLQEVTALPLNLSTLQDLLIGNAVFLDSNVVSYTHANNAMSLVSLGKWFKTLLTVSEPDYALQRIKLDDIDITRSRTAELNYSDYQTRNGQRFATRRRINIVEKKKVDIALDYKQYTFNEEVSFPFTVPKNFRQQ
jgi:outer membrane lipoprotein-sorting protein